MRSLPFFARRPSAIPAVNSYLLLPVVAMLTTLALVLLGIVYVAAQAEDRAIRAASGRLAAAFIQVRERTLQRVLRDHARWNEEAIQHLSARVEDRWIDDNLGPDFAATHDLAYVMVLDGSNRVVYLARDGVRLKSDLDAIMRSSKGIQPLIAAARAASDGNAAASPLAFQGDSVHLAVAALLDGGAPVGGDDVNESKAVLLVTRKLDGEGMRKLAGDYGLNDLRVVSKVSSAHDVGRLPLSNIVGGKLGYLVWKIDLPGDRLLRRVLPAVLLALLATGGLLAVFLFRVRGVVGRIEADATEIARSGRHLARIVENVSDGLLTVGRDGRIESVNPAAAAIFGRAAADLAGQPLAGLLKGGVGLQDSLLQESASGATAESRLVAGLRGDGREIDLRIEIGKVGDGPEEFHLALVRDVSGENRSRELLDLMASAMVVVDGEGRYLYANGGGEMLLSRHDGLVATDGLVRAARGDGKALRDAVRAAANPTSADTSVVPLARDEGKLFYALVAPLRSRTVRDPSAAIFLRDPDFVWNLPEQDLSRAFALTRAEARVVVGVVRGKTIRDIAAENGLSPNTVRNQLAHVFQKTGTSRQAELVALVLTSVVALGSKPEPVGAGPDAGIA